MFLCYMSVYVAQILKNIDFGTKILFIRLLSYKVFHFPLNYNEVFHNLWSNFISFDRIFNSLSNDILYYIY